MPRKHNGKGRSRTGPPFIQLFRYMQDSPAWLALSPVARASWLEVARLYNGTNNGRLALSVADLAARLGKSDATAWRALKELVAAGFIEVVRQGYWKPVAELRVATEYRLTCYRCDVTGDVPSKAFLRKSAVSKMNVVVSQMKPSGTMIPLPISSMKPKRLKTPPRAVSSVQCI